MIDYGQVMIVKKKAVVFRVPMAKKEMGGFLGPGTTEAIPAPRVVVRCDRHDSG